MQRPSRTSALAEEMLSHVTSFFHDPSIFEALATQVVPRLVAGRPSGIPIRVWVPGCSTGEEVYSIGVLLLEALAEAEADFPVTLVGSDVDDSVLERARSGRYAENIAIDVPAPRLRQYFVSTEGGYRIHPKVRDMCVFVKQDVTRDPPFSNMDLVSCRNINLGPALKDRVLPLLRGALNDRGFLMLGSLESAGLPAGFTAVDAKHKLYARIPLQLRVPIPFGDPRLSAPAAAAFTPQKPQAANQAEIEKHADQAVLAEYGPPGVIVDDNLLVLQFRGHTGAYLQHPPGFATLDLLPMVRSELRVELRQTFDEARRTGKAAHRRVELERAAVDLGVVPFAAAALDRTFYAVLFEEVALPAPARAAPAQNEIERLLRNELAQTREYLQSVIEELEARNEDLKVANEELTTVNQEMTQKGGEAVAAADDFATSVIDTLREGLLVLEEDLRIRSASRSFCQAFDLSRGEVEGRLLAEVGNGQWNDPILLRALEEALAGTALAGFVFDHDFPRLGRRILLLNARRFEGDAAGAPQLLLAIEDATGPRRSEEALREMLAAAAEPVLMHDAEGRIVFANSAAHQTFGFDPGELLGTSVDLLIPERLRSRYAAHRAIAGASTIRPKSRPGMNLFGLRKDGTKFPAEVTLTLLKGATGTYVVAFVNDISARKEAERRILDYQEKLRQMAFDAAVDEDRERRRMAANLHDAVGQTLALAQIKLAPARSAASGELRAAIEECVHLIEDAIAQTRSLIFDLSPPILYDLGLGPALRWLAEQNEKRYGLRVEVEGGDDLEMAPETAAVVFRSVRELLANVFKHAGTHSAKLTVEKARGLVRITVADEGEGFDLSEPGARSGFGLFSVREQIERLGGSVDVRSAPGKGTRVSIVAPTSKPQEISA